MPREQPTLELVQTLIASGRRAEADEALARLLKREPQSTKVRLFAGQLAASDGDHERALAHGNAVLGFAPESAAGLRLVGMSLSALGRHDEAVRSLQQLEALQPSDPSIPRAISTELLRSDRADDAETALRRATTKLPGHTALWSDLAQMQLSSGRATEAVGTLEQATALHPRDIHIAQFLASAMNYVPGVVAARVRSAHERAARLLEPPALRVTHANSPLPNRPLRIGFLSPDLHRHSVAYFLLPVVAHLDRSRAEPHLFWTGQQDDEYTARFRDVGVWHPCFGLSDAALCQRIRSAAIDVLIELSGLTTGNAMSAIALHPAPVQLSAIGYPSSTGLRSIDARIADSITDPPEGGVHDPVVRVDPCFLCYEPPQDMPEPSFNDSTRPPTFGSFNAIQKLNPELLSLWAEVMRESHSSRMLLKADLRLTSIISRIRASFERAGISPDRLSFVSNTRTSHEAMALYASIDVALDTHPYNGTTTTCEALWMGVPVVTLRGSSHVQRVSASLLTAAGVPDLIADSAEAYVRIARELIQDRTRVLELRATLRERVRRSPLCDASAYATRFEASIRGLWRAWCERVAAPADTQAS